MRFHKQHEQTENTEIKRLIEHQPTALLITFSEEGAVHLGIYNILFQNDLFFLHIGRTDEQANDLEINSKCVLVFQDILSVIPSYWIDERYGGAINQFFRYAEFHCEAKRIENGEEMTNILQPMLDRFQKERLYDPLDPSADIYRDKFQAICCIELTPHSFRTKRNVGQTKPFTAFTNVISRLRLSGETTDARTADEMERWRMRHKTPTIPLPL